ncbi:MAG: ABC transporter transmembrane domain-containing protein [Flavobacteriaceae bacterium]
MTTAGGTSRELPADAAQEAAEGTSARRAPLRPLRRMWPFVRRYPGMLAAAVAALLAAALATLAVPMALRRIIDNGFGGGDPAFVNRYFAVMIVVVGVLALASASRYYLVTWLGERVVADIRKAVFGHILTLSVDIYDRARAGEIVSRLTADTTQIKAAVGASMSIALRNLVLGIGATVMMVVTSPGLSALVLIAIPFIVLPLVAFGRAVRRKSRLAQDTLAEAGAQASEVVGAIRTVQAFSQQQGAATRFAGAVERAFEAARASTRARAVLTAIALFMVFASVVAVLWYGAQDVLAGRLTAGTLSQFVLYSVFAAGALSELSQVWGEVQLAAGAAERTAELLDTRPSIEDPKAPLAADAGADPAIELADVDFTYPVGGGGPVFDGLTFALKRGETVALVGPSGAGKSSVFNLLLRFYDRQSGLIRVGGQDVRALALDDLRHLIAYVPQDPVIFAATIGENIRFGRPDASDADVARAAEAARVGEFVESLPQGFDTPVGERGVTLSGGQRQRIAIARAILRDAPILLLDEATSALDAESEKLVQKALEKLMKGRTTLVVAHRLATVKNADRILVMDGGRIVEQGTHAALSAKKGGLYARLAKLQFADA